MASLLNELKSHYKSGEAYIRLLIINIAVFVFINIFGLLLWLTGNGSNIDLIRYFGVPASLSALLLQPWSIFTYMFVQKDLLHILGNMLMLYFAGRIVENTFGSKRVWSLYILGGFAGALFYMLIFNLFPVFNTAIDYSFTIGSSASVLAIMIALASYYPEMEVLLFFLPIRLKYLAIFIVILDLVSIDKSNPGGHIAHLGGALLGYVFVLQYKKGKDITAFFSGLMDKLKGLFSKKSKMKVVHRNAKNDEDFNAVKKQKQQRMDEILDKISKSGYESLSKEEKNFLFKISKDQ